LPEVITAGSDHHAWPLGKTGPAKSKRNDTVLAFGTSFAGGGRLLVHV
jgi:hypothetical protein